MKVRALVAAACALFGNLAFANSANEIGRVESSQGAVVLLVLEVNGKKTGAVYVRDRNSIKTNLLTLDKTRLQELRGLIDTTLAALEEPPK